MGHVANQSIRSSGWRVLPDDEHGNFDERRLDALFREHGKRFGGEALTVSEIVRMLRATLMSCVQRNLKDASLMPTGIGAVAVERAALVAGGQRDRGAGA